MIAKQKKAILLNLRPEVKARLVEDAQRHEQTMAARAVALLEAALAKSPA